MIPLRLLARSAPRSAVQLFTRSTSSQLFHLRPSAARAQLSWKQASSILFQAPFHTSLRRRVDSQELVAKLQSEINGELDERDPDTMSPLVKEYLETGPFKVEDIPGKQEVVLTRSYNDETIKITFSIVDITAMEDLDDADDSQFLPDEEDDLAHDIMGGQSGGANTKGSVNQGRTPGGNIKVAPEDRLSPADRDELAGDDEYPETPGTSFDAHASIVVTRPNKGALQIDAVARDGDFLVTGLNYFPDENLAEPTTPEKQMEQANHYGGPPFANLDEELQRMIEQYIEERGIDTQLAIFIPEYIENKEQNEYLAWLERVKKFIE